MTKEEWKINYINTLINVGRIDQHLAESTYDAGIEDHDFMSDPEIAAVEELNYWPD